MKNQQNDENGFLEKQPSKFEKKKIQKKCPFF